MPKDRAEVQDQYKIGGGSLNEFEFDRSKGEMEEREHARPEGGHAEGLRGAAEPNAPQNVAERIRQVEEAAHEKVERLRAKRGAGRATNKGASKKGASKGGAGKAAKGGAGRKTAKGGAGKKGAAKSAGAKKGGASKKSAKKGAAGARASKGGAKKSAKGGAKRSTKGGAKRGPARKGSRARR